MDLGMNIRYRREQLALSQAALARACGLTQARISEWESGARTQMSLQNLRSLARALGVSADYLIGTWEDDTAPAPPTVTPAPPEESARPRRRGRPRKPAPAGA